MVEILPELWIGSKSVIEDDKFMMDNKFACIINCTKDNINSNMVNVYIDMNVSKFEYNMELINRLEPLTEYIHDYICKNKSVLIYCDDGYQISPVIIVGYIMKYGKLSMKQSIEMVRTKSPKSFETVNNFDIALQRFERDIEKK